jgi:4-amino-4-deoxy-L-arabinose transferase-like glycosyltransferase
MKKKSAEKKPEPVSPAYRRGLIAVALITLGFAAVIFFNIILKLDIFHWDESHHAFFGLQLAQAVQRGDWEGFWFWTDRQTLWPFFHSWCLTVFFLLLGISERTARLMSLFIYGLTAVLLYLTAGKLSKTAGWKIGLLAALFFLTAPLTISFSAQNMLEGLGALEFLLAVYLFFLAEESQSPWWYLATGLLLGITLVTKYNYALLIVLSFGVLLLFELIVILRSKQKKLRLWSIKGLLLFGPVVLTAAGWFFSGDSARKIQMALFSQEVSTKQDIMPSLWSNIAFYPNAIIHDYFFTPWLGWLALLALCLPLAVKKLPRAAAPYFSAWTSLLLLLTVVGTKMNRLFYPVIPLVYLVLAVWFFHLVELAKIKFNLQRNAVTILIALLLLPAALSLPRLGTMLSGNIGDIAHGLKVRPEQERLSGVIGFFRGNLPRDRSVSTAISGGQLSPYVFSFYFYDWQAPFYNYFQAGQPGFGQTDFLITLEQKGGDRILVNEDSLNKWNAYAAAELQAGNYVLYREQDWPALGITAKILAKKGLNLLQKIN